MSIRSRGAVFSIRTYPAEEQTLKAEIKAANTQQKIRKRLTARSLKDDTIEEEPHRSGIDCSGECEQCSETISTLLSPQSSALSRKSLRGTVRGKFSTAKHSLKNTSKRHLDRLRSHSSQTEADQQVSRWVSGLPRSNTVNTSRTALTELDSPLQVHPKVVELGDPERSPKRAAGSTAFALPQYQDEKKEPVEMPLDGGQESRGGDLTTPSRSCDSCQQSLTGKDLYDFCPACPPGNRVICVTCFMEGGCWRHRSDKFNLMMSPSSRYSPAPSYEHEEETSHDNKQQMLENKAQDTSHSHPTAAAPISRSGPRVHTSPRAQTIEEAPVTPASPQSPGTRGGDILSDQKELLDGIKKLLHTECSSPTSEVSVLAREVSLREQQTAVREQQVAIREQQMLLREQESICRERDATMIRNLQTLVTFRELARAPYIGAQFQPAKGNDYENYDYHNIPARSKSTASVASDTSISLDKHADKHGPREALAKVVADVEASVVGGIAEADSRIRERPAQKRRKGHDPDNTTNSSLSHKASKYERDGRPVNDKPRANSDGEDDEEDQDVTPPRKPKQQPTDSEPPQRLFACPYSKYDPIRFSHRNLTEKKYRTCSHHYLQDISRLKQHLVRTHWRPQHHCLRCYSVFKTAVELHSHMGQPQGCDPRDCPFPEKMDRQQQEDIHKKRPTVSPEKQWYDIYKVLFPGGSLPDSPYAEEQEISPPQSAGPSAGTGDETAKLLQQAFSARMEKRGAELGLSDQQRDSINHELARCLMELKVTLTPMSSPGGQMPVTPTIVVSPHTPPAPSEVPSAALTQLTPSPKHRSTKTRGLTPQKLENMQTPQLREPKRPLSPALKLPTPGLSTTAAPRQSNDTGSHASSESMPTHNKSPYSDVSTDPLVSIDIDPALPSVSRQFNPYTFLGHGVPQEYDLHPIVKQHGEVLEDQGYDHQSSSYQIGDDHQAMVETALHVPMPTQARRQPHGMLKVPEKPRSGYRKPHRFVPVSTTTLRDDYQTSQAATEMPKSAISLLDSGYGSGKTVNASPTSSSNRESAFFSDEMDLDDSPAGHETFLETFEALQQGREDTTDDIGMAF